MLRSPYIYEFDLKGFFDNVPVERVMKYLQEQGMPQENVQELTQMAKSFAKLPEVRELDETNEIRKGFKFGQVDTYIKRQEKPAWWKTITETPSGGISVVFDMDEVERLNKMSEELKGFPQGSAISPLLSIMLMQTPNEHKLLEYTNLLMYADDGLVYSYKKFDPQDVKDYFKGFGIEIAEEKSG